MLRVVGPLEIAFSMPFARRQRERGLSRAISVA